MREANQRIREVASTFGDASRYELLCECVRRECLRRMSVPEGAFETVRRSGTQFVVSPGHEAHDERVLARDGAYLVVELRPRPLGDPLPSTA